MRLILVPFWLALASMSAAEDRLPGADGARLAEVLPEELVDRLRRGAVGYVARTSDMILSFGTEKGLAPEGIDWKVASDRAEARAAAQKDFLTADRDNDGLISEDETERLASLQKEHQRGRLVLNFRAADANGDRIVDTEERVRFVDLAAVGRVPEQMVYELQATMLFDLDGDGFVVIDEVVAGVAALQALDVTKAKKEI